MCGIIGSISFQDHPSITEHVFIHMRDAMVHRGPDGGGYWRSHDGKINLGHRRLSIIDLNDNANQPMGDPESQIQLVYNGEIYNHAELRLELESLGHHFRTNHSDTEVLLRSYIQWGKDCIHKLIGMFAFGLWDPRNQELWLVRDRIGVKPLYYALYNGRLTFASEIKGLIKDPDLPRKVNESAMLQYLSFLAPPAPHTLYQGVEKLAGGCWLTVQRDGSIQHHRYWDALDNRQDLSHLSDTEISDMVLNSLEESVSRRMVSDVPVGVFLSGGIDSSTNAALFTRQSSGQAVKTFSIGYDQEYDSYKNELDFATHVANHLGTDHHELRLTQKDLVDFLPQMVDLQDEPIGDPVCVPLYHVSKLARENGVIVCQVGEGADELFWGYPNWMRALKMQNMSDRLPVPNSVRKLGLKTLEFLGKDYSLPHDWLYRSSQNRPIFWGGAEALPHKMRLDLMSEDMIVKHGTDTSWQAIEPIWKRFLAKGGGSRLKWMTYLDLNFRLPELLLMRVDKMSMGVSLESRVPFLDHRLVEQAISINEEVLTRDNVLKTVLKRAVRGIIPDTIIDRPKQGFGVPVHDWMMAELGDYAREVINDFTNSTNYFDPRTVNTLLESGRSSDMWNLLNLALWWKRYMA
ncbi:asparagine synthase (glutamine-hydrolyzing) [Kiloniella majae]|uniref:asparagine synthase (glutamine-hydrolyzing) n=1 Tax=Kiloniella majae TaxID=1938558 RepID=UPI000A2788A5|nr:asparagine synthase (glutamine-hydrolyzing) [Kiloniella majae]